MIDILKERNTFITASKGSEIRDSLINLLVALNDGWTDRCVSIDAAMTEIKQNPVLEPFMMLTEMQHVGRYAFRDCSFLSTIQLNNAETIGFGAFSNCQSLSYVSIPKAKLIGQHAFVYCSSLSSLDMPAVEQIDYGPFYFCSNLSSVTLGWSSVCYTSSSDVFGLTPLASGIGHIYVPTYLLSAYLADPIWSFYSSVLTEYDEPAGEEEAVEA